MQQGASETHIYWYSLNHASVPNNLFTVVQRRYLNLIKTFDEGDIAAKILAMS